MRIPEPVFAVFYNGVDDAPERQELLLSSSYYTKSENPALELRVTVYNINKGFNEDLKEHCRTLNEYMQFVALVREYSKTMPFEMAVQKAVDECIKRGVLADFLRKNKAEVVNVGIFEFDEEIYSKSLRKEGERKGRNEGMDLKLRSQVRTKLAKGRSIEQMADELEETPEKIREVIAQVEAEKKLAEAV